MSKNALQKVARPPRREAKTAIFDVFVDARKTRIPHDTANPTTTLSTWAAQDVSSEMATFFKSDRFARDILAGAEQISQQ